MQKVFVFPYFTLKTPKKNANRHFQAKRGKHSNFYITRVARSAHIVVRSISQSYGDSKISGDQNSKTPEPIDKNLARIITSAMIPRMPKLKTREWRHMRELSPSRGF